MRVGVVDLGTNTTRLLVADVHDEHVDQVVRHSEITRLGEGVDKRRKLLPLPMARVRNVLSDYRRELEAIGVAGTNTTLAALELGGYDPERVHGYRISREAVEQQLHRLASLPLAERRELPGLEPERAPVIVGGALIVKKVLDRYGLDGIEV